MSTSCDPRASGSVSQLRNTQYGTPLAANSWKAAVSTRAWAEIPLTHGYAQNSRSLGLADLAYALRTGRPARAGGELCYHVLEIMHAIHHASDQGRHIDLESTCAQPAPLPMELLPCAVR